MSSFKIVILFVSILIIFFIQYATLLKCQHLHTVPHTLLFCNTNKVSLPPYESRIEAFQAQYPAVVV